MLAITKDGYLVRDRHKSHIHREALPFVEEAVARIDTEHKAYVVTQIVFDEPIGESKLVTTSAEDEILFAQRINRHGMTRFVKERQSELSAKMTVVLKRSECGKYYVLITAYVGDPGMAEPWDWERHLRTADPLSSYYASVDFWATHALVWDPQVIIPGSESVHPWH